MCIVENATHFDFFSSTPNEVFSKSRHQSVAMAASIAQSRLAREFKEVITSSEVSDTR